jgi:hypothetical protein
MTAIALPADATAETVRAALAQALDAYGPPVTIVRPDHPNLTVACTAAQMHDRLAAFWGALFRNCLHDGALPVPQAATERSVRHARPNVAGLVAASGADSDTVAGSFFSAVGVAQVAPTARRGDQ